MPSAGSVRPEELRTVTGKNAGTLLRRLIFEGILAQVS